jgi:hypothetical protein
MVLAQFMFYPPNDEIYGVHFVIINFRMFIASTSSPSSPPLGISMPTTCIMAARTKLDEETESADNEVTKLKGGLRYVRMAKTV